MVPSDDPDDGKGCRVEAVGKLSDEASGLRYSEFDWEPGSAMVPTFFVRVETMFPLAFELLPGNASPGDGDLPGDGGGDPKSESSSSPSRSSGWGLRDILRKRFRSGRFTSV